MRKTLSKVHSYVVISSIRRLFLLLCYCMCRSMLLLALVVYLHLLGFFIFIRFFPCVWAIRSYTPPLTTYILCDYSFVFRSRIQNLHCHSFYWFLHYIWWCFLLNMRYAYFLFSYLPLFFCGFCCIVQYIIQHKTDG